MEKNYRRKQSHKFADEHSICQQEGPEYNSEMHDIFHLNKIFYTEI
jgi:hypothetical protein